MEVTTVFPSPASPTEGDNLCEIDVTNVAIHSVALLISLCGLPGNGAVFCILDISFTTDCILSPGCRRLPLSPPHAPVHTAPPLEDVSCSALVPLGYLSFHFQLSLLCSRLGQHHVFMNITGLGSVALSLFCYCCCFFPEPLLCVVMSALPWAFFAVITLNPTVVSLCQFHEELCQVPLISMYALNLLLFAPFMLISSAFLCIQDTYCSEKGKSKSFHIVIFLSLLIILPLSLWNFLPLLSYTIVLFLLAGISNTIKPFIYFLVGRCWKNCSVGSLRESLQRVFGEPEENTASSNDASRDMGV